MGTQPRPPSHPARYCNATLRLVCRPSAVISPAGVASKSRAVTRTSSRFPTNLVGPGHVTVEHLRAPLGRARVRDHVPSWPWAHFAKLVLPDLSRAPGRQRRVPLDGICAAYGPPGRGIPRR